MTPERWRKIEELYHEAVVRDPGARAAFLDGACGPDTELLREIESLLQRESKAEHFLESGPQNTTEAGALPEQVGPYKISARLGAGGMGVVYRAHDTKLGRDVALKTLPREFASNPERLARFRREARLLASLNHPNIAAIYGLEESEGATCLVIELVEGQELRGPIPVERALDCALQLAEALEAAHAQGIVHRDLKPANIKITPQERVKVLDFGLAKALWGCDETPDLVQEPAATALNSAAGLVAGTPPYMSPEQVRGGAVDQRGDIWAFGCLLYELLTGKRAFCGETFSDTLAAILELDPDWSALPRRTPARIRKLLRRCLDRDADSRLASIQSAREEIVRVRRRLSPWQLATLGIVAFAILAAGPAVYLRSPARPAVRSEWLQLTNFPDPVSQPALSPDGRMLTFVRGPETFAAPGEIYVKNLPNGVPVQLTRDGLQKMSPVFSPDGSRIAYTVVTHGDQVWDTWIVPSASGQARPWLTNASGLVWLSRQRLLFSEIEHDIHMGLVTSDENGGGRRSIYLPAGRRGMAHRSYPSPDRRWAILIEMDRGRWRPCRLVPMDGGSAGRPIGPPGGACTVAGWSPDGKWIYLNSSPGGTYHIWRQRFPDGKPQQLTSGPTEEEGIAVTPDGGALITSVGLRQSVVFVHGPSGDRQVSMEGFSYDPKFTPDGKKLCYRILKGVDLQFDPSELRVVDLDSGHSEPLLPGLQIFGQTGLAYDLSPDGRQVVAAARDPEGKGRLWLAALDQPSPARLIPNIEGDNPHFGVGGEIIFRVIETASSAFLYRVNQDGSQLRRVVEEPVAALRGISPDGRWLVVRVQTETSSTQMAFPTQGGVPIPIHTGEAWWWNWSADQTLLYISVAESAPLTLAARTYVIPLAQGRALPRIPEGGFQRSEDLGKLPGVRIIDAFATAPGPNRYVYAFPRVNAQRNLYRIPLH